VLIGEVQILEAHSAAAPRPSKWRLRRGEATNGVEQVVFTRFGQGPVEGDEGPQ